MGEIFISYSRQDQEFTDALTSGLEREGLRVWVDRENIQAGELWRAAISRAVAECDAFLVVLSPNCIASKNVVKELSMAESKDRHIVPLMYQECQIPPEMEYQLAGLQWIYFTEGPFEQALERLIRTLRGGRGKRSPETRQAKRAEAWPFASQPRQVPQPAPQSLAQILCGRWDVQFGSAYGAGGRVAAELYANGVFNGQVMTPAGLSTISGQWQVTGPAQVVFQGQQTMGWMVNPYFALVQFSQVSANSLSGMSGAGEQVIFRRTG